MPCSQNLFLRACCCCLWLHCLFDWFLQCLLSATDIINIVTWILTFCFVPFFNASTFYWWLIINNCHSVLFPLFSNLLHCWIPARFFSSVFNLKWVFLAVKTFLLLHGHRKGKKEKILGDGYFKIIGFFFSIVFF